MKIQRHHTKSGSVYDFCFEGPLPHKMRRLKLGEAHAERGPERVQKRLDDPAGLGEWRPFASFDCHGVGDFIRISFGDGDHQKLSTNYVIKIEHLEEL